MAELSFTSKLTWSGGSQGVVETGGQSLQFSMPASMGGLGVGTSPEELLLSAVGSCYTATLAGLTEARRLPLAACPHSLLKGNLLVRLAVILRLFHWFQTRRSSALLLLMLSSPI